MVEMIAKWDFEFRGVNYLKGMSFRVATNFVGLMEKLGAKIA